MQKKPKTLTATCCSAALLFSGGKNVAYLVLSTNHIGHILGFFGLHECVHNVKIG